MSQLPLRHILSKSTFVRGCKCIKALWLYKNCFDQRDEESSEQSAIFLRGTDVGKLAQQLFPGGEDATPIDVFHYPQSIADTDRYIAEGRKVIYEAAFQYDGVMCAIDILVKHEDGWHAYEVKSSTKVKEPFLLDAALQYHVITNAGLALEDISIIHLNNEYVRYGELDLDELFTITSVADDIEDMQQYVYDKIVELKAVAQQKKMPVIETGAQCDKPYSCDFKGFCNKDLEQPAISHGIEQVMQDEIKEFVDSLEYPLYFMDFETYMLAVPEYDGHWPYRQVPFQFSVHVQDVENGPLKHIPFLANNGCDPCPEFVERLVKAMGKNGSVIVYNKTFENCRLNELKEDYPQYANEIAGIQDRLVDLMTPFRKRHYYLPEMQGSYSLKYVLPALVPDLSYGSMTISNGGDASAAFYNLRFEKNKKVIQLTRKALLDYCELDTLGMVKVLEKLKEV